MKRPLLLIGTITLIGACDTPPHPRADQLQYSVAPNPPANEAPAAAVTEGGYSQRGSPAPTTALYRRQKDAGATASAEPIGRMVTRTAEIRAVVTHPDSTSAALTTAVQAAGGFVEDAREWRASGQTLASLTLRVPDDRLSSILDSVKHFAIRVAMRR